MDRKRCLEVAVPIAEKISQTYGSSHEEQDDIYQDLLILALRIADSPDTPDQLEDFSNVFKFQGKNFGIWAKSRRTRAQGRFVPYTEEVALCESVESVVQSLDSREAIVSGMRDLMEDLDVDEAGVLLEVMLSTEEYNIQSPIPNRRERTKRCCWRDVMRGAGISNYSALVRVRERLRDKFRPLYDEYVS